MVYLVTKNQELFANDVYTIINVQESLDLLNTIQIVGLDTETSGLDCHTDKLLLVQLGCKDFQVVIDCRTIDIKEYKEYLESDRLFLGWNLMFDLQWFYEQSIIIKNVYDGFLVEKLLWLGYPAGMHSMSLKSAGENYLNIELDKSVRGKIIWSKTLTNDIIEYSANDVKYLEDIKNAQDKLVQEQDLINASKVENNFVRVLAYIEWCGVKLDINKWKQKIETDNQLEQKLLNECNQWITENLTDTKFVIINRQGDLFEGYDLTPKSTINWQSPKQVVELFQYLNINTYDERNHKHSVEIKKIAPQKDKSTLIPIYIKYKEASQVCKMYGEKFINQINPNTKRLHTNWHCIGTDTARVSCGSTGEESINLLNLPADALTRSCFIAEEGNCWISIDYSGQETFLMASIANDKAIIDELTYGSGDIHSLTAYMSYMEIPRDTPIKEIKKKYHNLRQDAKGIE